MKRKVLVTLCLCMIGLAGTVTGCGSKKEETPVVEEEKKEPELKAIGQEDKEAFKVEVKNATGKNIKGVAIKLTDEDAYREICWKKEMFLLIRKAEIFITKLWKKTRMKM